MLPKKQDFERRINGKQVSLYTLKNSFGSVLQITNYGGRVVSLWVEDKNGIFEDVVLGYDNLAGYLDSKEKYFGAIIGRFGNRIANGKFTLNGVDYVLDSNNGVNHIHGGNKGFDKVVWDVTKSDEQTLELFYHSLHMEDGYPGNLRIKVKYQLTENNELKIEYWATTDRPTIVNLTNHSFFNLRGAGSGTINNHLLQINADHYTPIDKGLIPTGCISTVENTPMDFRVLTRILKRINDDFEQLKYGLGYDHNFVLNQSQVGHHLAAKVIDSYSGRIMEVRTNEPGIQFYGGNFLDGSINGKRNKPYKYREAFCLETQHYPDSPNKINFPTTRLGPGEEYYSLCIYKFSINNE